MFLKASLICWTIVAIQSSFKLVIIWTLTMFLRPVIHVDCCDFIDLIEVHSNIVPAASCPQICRDLGIHLVAVPAGIVDHSRFKEEKAVTLHTKSEVGRQSTWLILDISV